MFAFALIIGILFAEYGGRWMLLPAAVYAVAAVRSPFLNKNFRECILRGALLLAAGMLGAGCYVRHADTLKREQQTLLCGQQLTVCGTLIRKEIKNERWQLTLALPGYENRVVVSSQDGEYPLGCDLSVSGLIYEFNTPRNEGQFNEQQYQKAKRVIGRMAADSIVCIRAPSGIYAWREQLYQLRLRLCAVYESCLPTREAGILSAMAVGEKTLLDEDVRTLFQSAGISHILAISGMHISMIGMGIYTLLRKCRNSFLRSALVTAAVLMLYGTLIGLGVSASRAIGMFLIYLLAQCLGRGYDTASALAVLAILLLTENPFLLHDVSFQFSFLAVFAVVTAEHVLPKKEIGGRSYRKLRPVCMSLLLQLFTLPLVAYYDYEVPMYALLLNFILLPYLGVTLGFGLLGGVAGTFLLPCARMLLLPCRVVLSAYVWVCEKVELLPFSTVICGRPSIGKLCVYYLLLGFLIFLLNRGKQRWAARISGLTGEDEAQVSIARHMEMQLYIWVIAISFMLLALLLHVSPGGFEIDYLDVGQGDASMLRTDDGTVCFIDGGSTDVSGVGTYRLLPFLKSKGIRKVDYWILSHLDEDHVNGFYEVLEAGYRVDAVVISVLMPEDEAKEQLLAKLAQNEVAVFAVHAGDIMQLHNHAGEGMFSNDPQSSETVGGADDRKNKEKRGALLRFLAPDETTPVYDYNGSSLVCLYEDANVRALWTGDIGKSQEEWLLKSGKLHEIDIYKAAHHGSRFSNSQDYLELLSPRISIISCALRNRYGHPEEAAVHNIEATGSRIFYTMKSGQIKIKACENGVVAEEFGQRNATFAE